MNPATCGEFQIPALVATNSKIQSIENSDIYITPTATESATSGKDLRTQADLMSGWILNTPANISRTF